MALRIAVTGSPGVGKSTLVAKVTSGTKLRVGGVLARDRRYKDRRTGFELLDLSTGMVGILADESGDGPQLGKYRVHLDDLDLIGAQAVENALGCDLIVVDEVGPMELSSHRFVLAVEKAIASPKPMLVVLHQWSNHRLAKKIRGSFRVLTVTRENRDSLADEIAKALKSG
ncbi:MAG: NTPase [Methanothrix soehngenii]|jgi:nucleoside-triphosphatase|uniref:NTPase n=3 Tax=Methanothrix soehngenii TaxID=2223 RepID=A0A7K4AI74_METSH|nr:MULTISPECIES: NTPase [Methanothrix]NYT10776.1 NTPase [Methanosarcinales archaeon]OPX80489.1 MAG: NTPase [Methanosaeta sp. PtaB.Bin005]MBP7067885.1 NTPase [Methanothrix sp.]MDD3551539.1 NTPase [Methanothrix soehngenii]MDY0413114.1 NTPase [Methanothrix soehngenii]